MSLSIDTALAIFGTENLSLPGLPTAWWTATPFRGNLQPQQRRAQGIGL